MDLIIRRRLDFDRSFLFLRFIDLNFGSVVWKCFHNHAISIINLLRISPFFRLRPLYLHSHNDNNNSRTNEFSPQSTSFFDSRLRSPTTDDKNCIVPCCSHNLRQVGIGHCLPELSRCCAMTTQMTHMRLTGNWFVKVFSISDGVHQSVQRLSGFIKTS